MSATLMRRTAKQPGSPQAAASMSHHGGTLSMLKTVHSRITRWSYQPYWWMILGGLMAFLGYTVVDTVCGNCLQNNKYPAAGTDRGGEGGDAADLFKEITGPFDFEPAQLEYARCLRRHGWFHMRFATGDCSALATLHRQHTTAVDFDHRRCAKHVANPLDKVFLQPSKFRFRNGTHDVKALKDAFCSEDSRYLEILARHLPPDRPLAVLDAGAHIGSHTLLLTRFAKFHGKILALASNRNDMQLLRVNTDNVTHLVTRMHGMLVPEAVADSALFLNASTGTLRGYLGRGDLQRFEKLQRTTDNFKWFETATPPPGSGETPEGDGVPALSLRQLREFVPTRRFDVIRLDMYGTAAHIMNDAGSREVLCQAACLIVATRTESARAARVSWVLQELEDRGCPSSHKLVQVGSGGKYDVLCQEKAAAAAAARGDTEEGGEDEKPRRKGKRDAPLFTALGKR
eukprot:jgi/Ulvmu1/9640/UM054_0072.1